MKQLRIIVTFLLVALPHLSYGADEDSYFIKSYPKVCKHGLHPQPNGPFSVFLFCDDAGGSNIGVILVEPGAGPGSLIKLLPKTKEWKHWDVNKRFWQDPNWATDVTGFIWSRSGQYLYVSTDGTYGDGGVFRINLIDRTYEKIYPSNDFVNKHIPKNHTYGSYFIKLNDKRDTATIELQYGGYDTPGIVKEDKISIE